MCKKQTSVSHISTESEVMSLDAGIRMDGIAEVDHVSLNTKQFRHIALMYIFEDNKAVIKMLLTGRSPATRPIARTHRVALD